MSAASIPDRLQVAAGGGCLNVVTGWEGVDVWLPVAAVVGNDPVTALADPGAGSVSGGRAGW